MSTEFAIGSVCEIHGYGDDGERCIIEEEYDADYQSYYVKVQSTGVSKYIPAINLKIASNSDSNEAQALNITDTNKSTITSTTSGKTNTEPDPHEVEAEIIRIICCNISKKIWYPLLIILLLIWFSAWSFGIWAGANLITQGKEYEAEATEEQCYITSRQASSCDTICKCDNLDKFNGTITSCTESNSDSRADTCYSLQYTYTATAESKCGSTSLTSNYIDSGCARIPRNLYQTYDCFVLDCQDEEFSFTESSGFHAFGTFVIVACSIPLVAVVLILGCCLLCCRGILCKDILGCDGDHKNCCD